MTTKETNLDLTKILKIGQEVYSPAFGFGKVVSTSYDIQDEKYQYPILVRFFHKINENSTKDEEYTVFRESFTKEGKYCHLTSDDAECILFPSKEERNWSEYICNVSEKQHAEMIDKVCQWLKFNIYNYAWMTVDYDVYIEIDELLEDMKKEILKED